MKLLNFVKLTSFLLFISIIITGCGFMPNNKDKDSDYDIQNNTPSEYQSIVNNTKSARRYHRTG